MKKILLLSSIALLASACEDTDNNSATDTSSDTQTDYSSITIDASSYEDFAYFSFETNSVVSETDPWDLALKRTSIIGSDASLIALAHTPSGYYDSEGAVVASSFQSADTQQEAAALSTAYDLNTLDFINDEMSYVIDSSWYSYNPTTHAISANPESWFIIANSDYTNFAKLHASAYDSATSTYTFEVFTQLSGETEFSSTASTFNVTYSGEDVCFDLTTNSTVDCTQTHDIHVLVDGHSIDISLTGSAYRLPLDQAGADAITSTADISANASELHYNFVVDAIKGALSENSWSEYGVAGGHGIWSNYRTYIIDTDQNDEQSNQYAFQVANYYNVTDGASGFITLNFKLVE